MKKATAILLSSVIFASLLCSCGKSADSSAVSSAVSTKTTSPTAAPTEANSEPKQGQRSQSARGFCPRSTMRVPQPDIIEHFGNADAVPQPPEWCLSRKAEIVRCCLSKGSSSPTN